ncbi:MAG: S9 family peptidase [Caulobacterales bacterium]|nr:S9 family peptidase [Caulobacterales bacterium]
MTAAIAPAAGGQEPERLTAERLYADPPLSGGAPRGVSFAPGGERLAFLRGKAEDALRQDLWAYDLATGEERVLVDADALSTGAGALSEEEKARRERLRIRSGGIVEYSWNDRGDAVLAPLDGDLFYVDLAGEEPVARRLTETAAAETDARIAPGGRYVSFVREGGLYLIDLESGEEKTVAADASEVISYGVAEFVAQEEMYRFTGYWWSADGRRLAYTRVDESPVEVVERFDIGAEGVTVTPQRYPRAGEANAVVELYVLDVETGSRVEVDLGRDADIYLARAHWLGDRLIVERQNRAQTRLDLLSANPSTGATRRLLSETSETWVNLSRDFTAIEGGEAFLWTSERSGYRHIYLYNARGRGERQLTSGDWPVAAAGRDGGAIVGVDEGAGLVYFLGFKDGPLEQHLYAVSYREPGEPRRVTAAGGWWTASMNDAATAFVGSFSHPDQPPQVGLYDVEGTRLRWIEENALDTDHPYAPFLSRHVAPEFGVVEADDGTPLHYTLVRPPHCSAEAPCPAIVDVYGGPGVQTVRRDWWSTPFAQMLAQRGYVVFQLDNRGGSERGKAFEDVLHRRMGDVEVRDQLAGLAFLKGLDIVDADRVGVWGWSYGGYLALHLMAQAPDAFAAGVSGAPVSDWALYDTHYTERYLGMPGENADGYEASSIFPYLGDLTGKLLLIHGMSDDNVVFAHSTRVMRALQEAGTAFETMVYPGERHGIYSPGPRRHLTTTWTAFFDRHLKPTPAP